MSNPAKFRFSVDRGGTFTDIYAEVPGEPGFRIIKLLSEDPRNYPDAPREGIRRILEEVTGKPVPKAQFDAGQIEWIRMGTTVATNALLERKGAPSALVVTRGFGDILQIGNQNRPKIFDLEIKKPELLYQKVIEADERLRILREDENTTAVDGKIVKGITGDRLAVIRPLDIAAIKSDLKAVYDLGLRSLAVVLMHAYAWPDHERAIGRLALEIGFTQVSLSSQVMPRVKLVARGDTTMVDAYLNPHIRTYLDSFKRGFKDELAQTGLLFMQSDGGLAGADGFTGSRAILSGPAGGVVGYAMTTFDAERKQPVIGFDMGGTSTDVSRFGGEYELVFETEIAGVRIQAPQLHIKTVAAGGGSRLFFDNGMFIVGPESAGAHPGPVCYRKDGYLTVTDANLVLGHIQPRYFPHIFGPSEDQPLDVEAARKAMADLTEEINAYCAAAGLPSMTMEEAALGFIRVANEVMVRPIREISVMRGFDIKAHVLATFGGAGPQHACAVARVLGISQIFIHRFSGIMSAYGMGMADVVTERQQPSSAVLCPQALKDIETIFERLEEKASRELQDQGFSPKAVDTTRFLNLRYHGTDTAIMICRPEDNDYAGAFRGVYRREFGFDLFGRQILIDDIRIRARGKAAGLRRINAPKAREKPPVLDTAQCYFEDGRHKTLIYDLEKLAAGHCIAGPAILIHQTSTILIEPDCTAAITQNGDVEIKVGAGTHTPIGTKLDPVQLSIFSNLFMSIAEQMGRMLQKTAISTNIKERLDFSCALFGPHGELVANAPHLPVHLGSMSDAVRAQIQRRGSDLTPGDVLVSNHPAAGGSHLPDITVITPVFKDDQVIFWVAARGHHTDIGGITPGSMPPNSRSLEEEGACITSFKLVENGLFQEEGISELLRAPGKLTPAPGRPAISGTRLLADNISDLKAQIAANQKGIELVLEMVDHYGFDVVQAYMKYVQDAAEEAVRQRLKTLSTSKGMAERDTIRAKDYLDDGSPIVLALTIDRKDGSALFDFQGTGSQIWGNCNAPKAVTKSAILYCLRCLIEKDLPLNHGCLIPITVKIPKGSLLDPSSEAAVVGGNVLTSQRITDVVLKAFGVVAASQGCMNNFTFGNDRFGYYETIAGGAGAGPTWHGQTGVQTHMTNTRITDPEIMERRYPVLLREFSIRRGSGGRGRFNGGDGLVREVEFLEPLNVAILSERRVFAPYGLEGGESGKKGVNLFIRKDGASISMGAKNEILAQPGERFRIMSPGGGGFGTPTTDEKTN
ncbi:5-oxoprolinase [Desulfobacter hydrogenophilus]|uniref:5-oxoprolinase n=1 Tax=Desulfobacter hydrogenophilus TaxID=2291 RepID=A0A328FCB3_9BACT|nr:hydantoinase B/oxoprolinase family protein [Desulfobacter hydrogenophilus]NDY72202.1 5-oxoprolinase [Desulfobacter hydrogenophilus]QBH15117.1 5-oxoprolinase [Desulfobacter hydrogenophilus]RAM02208.1 5-oxoprolinase [Desulfobacter hydrogenophilus]